MQCSIGQSRRQLLGSAISSGYFKRLFQAAVSRCQLSTRLFTLPAAAAGISCENPDDAKPKDVDPDQRFHIIIIIIIIIIGFIYAARS